MKHFSLIAFALLFYFSNTFAASKFEVGNFPPPLKIEKWLKGDSVSRFQFGRVYVIEFWGTWCPSCLEVIFYMNELAKGYADDVTFVNVAASEHGEPAQQLAEVTKFLVNGQAPFETSVAFDSRGVMNSTWLEAAEAPGIPFVVVIDRAGKIAFTGHPNQLGRADLGNPLQLILKGLWVGSDHEKKHLREQAVERGIRKTYDKSIEAYIEATEKNNWEGAYHIAKRGAKLPEPFHSVFRALEADMLITRLGKVARGLKMLPPLVELDWNAPQALGNILELLIHDNVPRDSRDMPLAKKIADRVVELINQNPDPIAKAKFQKYSWLLLPQVAKFYALENDYARAIELQKQMIESLPAGDSKQAQMTADLDTYETEMLLQNRKVEGFECVGDVCVPVNVFVDRCNMELTDSENRRK